MVEGEGSARSRTEIVILIAGFVLALSGLVAAVPLDFPPLIVGASVGLGVCVATYGVFGGPIAKMSNARKVVAGLLAVAVIAGSALLWPPKTPAPPTQLTPEVSADSVTLTWDAPADRVKAYKVLRNGDFLEEVTDTRYEDKNVKPATEYEYSVIAVGVDGGESVPIKRKVSTLKPSATLKPPNGLAATAIEARSVTLAWTDSGPGLEYSVLRDGAKIAQSNQPTYTDTTVAPQTSYSYAVRVVDTAKREESESSPAVTVTTPAGDAPLPPQPGPTPPSAPKGFKHDRSNQSSITMSWQPSSPGSNPIAGYRVFRDGGLHKTANGLSFTDTDLPTNKSYEYFVRAFDTAGRESADSAHVRMSTLPWAKAGPWRYTLYDRSTADKELKDAIKFNGISQPTRTQVGVEDYAVAYDRAWTQIFYYGATATGSATPTPPQCGSHGFTGVDALPIQAGRVYCRDEDEGAAIGPISFVKFVDISHATETPGYITIEVWFEYLTP
ncbi:fibronectin type III domain-containing protein [Allorhizocola rhizosphaerae]|uniref:fibronectin type III domain-containing protein n=1 Tax=Allorhizocola rhizosphaerae TaxID=1872709 RepID=UPI000E3D80DE|nr:hypothetical protein [Allorhizocola rhizosphaerae]